MDRNETAKELIALGKSDYKLVRRATLMNNRIEKARAELLQALDGIERNRARRCELLQSVACHPDSGVTVNANEPKDD